jgi:WXXGXW repeat (2 copies)
MRERSELSKNRFSRVSSYERTSRKSKVEAATNAYQAPKDVVTAPPPKTYHECWLWLGKSARVIGMLVVAVAMLGAPATSSARVAIGAVVSFGPPALPVYYQPICPGPGYIWTPGYWAWDPVYGYYWVPGTWVLAPFPGALWTPGFWAFDGDDGGYVWNVGFWGPVVGFYGGINYGFGYPGYGYYGGYWRDGDFYYNRTVNNVRISNITRVYSQRVVEGGSHVSYNGGRGGVNAQPTLEQRWATFRKRSGPITAQRQQMRIARRDRNQWASANMGRPAVAATARPGAFSRKDIVRANRAGGPYHRGTQAAPRGGRMVHSFDAARAPYSSGAEPHSRMRIPSPWRGGPHARTEYSAPGRAPFPRAPQQHGRPPQVRHRSTYYGASGGRQAGPRAQPSRQYGKFHASSNHGGKGGGGHGRPHSQG